MVKVFCDMCGREIDYEVDGVNLDFNHYGVVNFKTPFSAEKQLCLSCAARVRNFVENYAKMDGGDNNAADRCGLGVCPSQAIRAIG